MYQFENVSLHHFDSLQICRYFTMVRYFYLAIASILIIGLFQNCQPFEAKPLNELASLCQATSKQKLLSSQLWKSSDCEELSHYKCAVKVYKPFIERTQYQDQECFDFNGEYICLNVNYELFDTRMLLMTDAIADEAFEEGGDFNRIEFRCTQSVYSSFEDVLVETGESISEAFGKAKSSCLQGARL
jgi:hypothetical protein